MTGAGGNIGAEVSGIGLVSGTGLVGVWETGAGITITAGPGVTGVDGTGRESLAVRRKLV